MSGENKFAAHFTPLHESASSTLFERTLASAASLHGIGFVHGKDVTLTYRPAPASTGIRFRRVDLPKQPTIAARFEYLLHQNRRTAIGSGESIVEMTEHVLAPLFALGVTSAYIDIDGDETPAGDGSSLVFQNAIDRAGIRQLESTIRPAVIREPIRIDDGGASIEIRPASAPGLHITYELDYDHPGIGHQSHSAWIDSATFRRDIAAARTFVMEQEVAALRQMGIGIRQSARDLLVFASDGSSSTTKFGSPTNVLDTNCLMSSETSRCWADRSGEQYSPVGQATDIMSHSCERSPNNSIGNRETGR